MVHFFRNILSVLILLTAVETSFGQQLLFRQLEVARKLSDLNIFKIEQDNVGFLWLGTNRGILKYNGTDFVSAALPDSIKRSPVRTLSIYENNVIAGFQNGCVAIINAQNPRLVEVRKISGVAISSCLMDNNGRLWIGTAGVGLYLVHPDGRFSHFTDRNQLADNVVNCVARCGDRVLVGTDLGLNVFSAQYPESSSIGLSAASGLPDNLITAIVPVNESFAWIGTDNGVVAKLEMDGLTSETIFTSPEGTRASVRHLMDVEDEIWIINEQQELVIYHTSNEAYRQNIDLTASAWPKNYNAITDALYDQEGNLIVCRGAYDLLIADCRFIYFQEHDDVLLNNIKAITCDKENQLWVATEDGIFSHNSTFDQKQLIQQVYRPKSNEKPDIISLVDGPDGNVWFGTFGSGLGIMNKTTGKVRWLKEKDGLLNNNVLSLAVKGSDVWAATLGGLSRITPGKKNTFLNLENNAVLGTGYIYNVYTDSHGDLWIASDGRGPGKLVDSAFVFLRDRFNDLGRSTVTIAEDPFGNLWFNSTDRGLQKFNGYELITVNISDDNKRPEVLAMQSDAFGNLIVFTSIGIGIVKAGKSTMQLINADDSFESSYLNVSARDVNGQIWMGTSNFLIRFRELSERMRYTPKTVLEEVLVMLQPIDTAVHTFSYDQNYVQIHTAGLWYQQPELVRYQYKLDGFDLDWVNTRDHIIAFPKLPPGNYTFMIRSSNGLDWDTAPVTSWSFVIKTPYWRTWWFILIVITGTLLLAGVFLLLRLKSIRRKEEFQRERLQGQFETLRNQVNPHFLFNSFNTLINIIEKDKSEAVDYVEKLSDYFRIILQQRDKDVISLREELDLVETYLFLQRKRFGNNLNVEIDVAPLHYKALMPPLTLQILVENVIKHNIITKAKPLSLRISVQGKQLYVTNSLQEKTVKEPSTGVGLQNIRNRYKVLFSQDIHVERFEDEFVVKLPLVETTTA
jgi:ligand-binding sensor domain-containing protein